MKKIIVDHNILFAAIHTRHSYTRLKLLESRLPFYTPNFLIVELFKHRERIVAKAKASEDDVISYLNRVVQKIHFFNEELISVENFIEAYHLCKDIDENDTIYIALTLELDGELWTRDNMLKAGLQKKGFNRFFDESKLI